MSTFIKNVTVIDGSGAPAFAGGLLMDDRGKLQILHGGAVPGADLVIDGAGKTAVPGFVDAHSHGDLTVMSPYGTLAKLNQGITSQAAGQCGISMFPCDPARGGDFRRFISGTASGPDFPADLSRLESAKGFFDWKAEGPNPVNTYSFVGHGALRLWAMGYENRRPTACEQRRMEEMLRRCLREGALGLSVGLVYPPGCYADNEELLFLLQVVREEGGVFACHPRDESDRSWEARLESMELAEQAGVPLCLSHMKACGKKNKGLALKIMAEARRRVASGQQILVDTYPYMAGATALNVSVPPRYFTGGMEGLVAALQDPAEREKIRQEIWNPQGYESFVLDCGGFEGVYVSGSPVFREAEGKFISDYAREKGMDPFDAWCDILIKNGGLSLAVYFHMYEEDVLGVLADPLTCVGTDGLLGLPGSNPHPRSFGTMPRAYHMLVTEHHACTPEEAIHRMTGKPAAFLGLKGKGLLRDGMDADVLLLDMDSFRDTSTYDNGNGLCTGIEKIFIGGKEIALPAEK